MSTLFRTVKVSFWQDTKVMKMNQVEKLTFFYLFTNSHSNTSCCYELPLGMAAIEAGYSCVEDFVVVLERLRDVWKVIDFDESTEEILVCNRGKYAWDAACKSCKQMLSECKNIKNEKMRSYIEYLAKNKIDETHWNNDYCNYYDGAWVNGEAPVIVREEKEEKEITDIKDIPENSRKTTYFKLYINSLGCSQAIKDKLCEYYDTVRGNKWFTFKQVKAQLKVLEGLNDEAVIKAIDESITRNWSGFYPKNVSSFNKQQNKVPVSNDFAKNINDIGEYKEY